MTYDTSNRFVSSFVGAGEVAWYGSTVGVQSRSAAEKVFGFSALSVASIGQKIHLGEKKCSDGTTAYLEDFLFLVEYFSQIARPLLSTDIFSGS